MLTLEQLMKIPYVGELIDRVNAMEKVIETYGEWPNNMDRFLCGRLYKDFRFIVLPDDTTIVLGNGMVEGITEQEFNNYVRSKRTWSTS